MTNRRIDLAGRRAAGNGQGLSGLDQVRIFDGIGIGLVNKRPMIGVTVDTGIGSNTPKVITANNTVGIANFCATVRLICGRLGLGSGRCLFISFRVLALTPGNNQYALENQNIFYITGYRLHSCLSPVFFWRPHYSDRW